MNDWLNNDQCDYVTGAVGGGAANADDQNGQGLAAAPLPVRGPRHQAESHLRHLHHNESNLCGPRRVAGQLEAAVPARGHDGARLRPHLRDHSLLARLPHRQESGDQDCHPVPFGEPPALAPGPL